MLTVTAASGTIAGCFLFSVGTMHEIWWDNALRRDAMAQLIMWIIERRNRQSGC